MKVDLARVGQTVVSGPYMQHDSCSFPLISPHTLNFALWLFIRVQALSTNSGMTQNADYMLVDCCFIETIPNVLIVPYLFRLLFV